MDASKFIDQTIQTKENVSHAHNQTFRSDVSRCRAILAIADLWIAYGTKDRTVQTRSHNAPTQAVNTPRQGWCHTFWAGRNNIDKLAWVRTNPQIDFRKSICTRGAVGSRERFLSQATPQPHLPRERALSVALSCRV